MLYHASVVSFNTLGECRERNKPHTDERLEVCVKSLQISKTLNGENNLSQIHQRSHWQRDRDKNFHFVISNLSNRFILAIDLYFSTYEREKKGPACSRTAA